MLILTRKEGEKVFIGSDIKINIISVSENQVKIGIEAPANYKILREELYEKIRQSTIESKLINKIKIDDLANLKLNKK
jgi:carbon storage regulator